MAIAIKNHGGVAGSLLLGIMMVPGFCAVICSYFYGHSLTDLGLNRCQWKPLALAYIIPAVSSIFMILALVITGIDQFASYGAKSVVKALLFQTTLGVATSGLFAAGEEIGWRGFLYTHLDQARVRHTALLTGLVWSAWHIPLILFSGYIKSPLPILGAVLFTVTLTSLSVFLGWLRSQTNSVFPAILAHATHSTWIQTITPSFFTAGALHSFFGGESGFVLAILYLFIAIGVQRQKEI